MRVKFGDSIILSPLCTKIDKHGSGNLAGISICGRPAKFVVIGTHPGLQKRHKRFRCKKHKLNYYSSGHHKTTVECIYKYKV